MRFREEHPSNDGSTPGSGADAHSQAYEALSRRVAKARAEQRLFIVPDPCQEEHRLADLEFNHLLQVYHNLSVPELVEHALMRGEGGLSLDGALCVKTVPHTKRSPQNTYIVGRDRACSPTNQNPWATAKSGQNAHAAAQGNHAVDPSKDAKKEALAPSSLTEAAFHHLYQEAQAYVQGRSLYVIEGQVGPGLDVRIVTELASHALFARQLLQSCSPANPPSTGLNILHRPVLIVLPGLKGEPSLEPELKGEVFTALHPTHGLALLGGSRFCGEMTAALLHLIQPLLLSQGILPLEKACLFQNSQGAISLVLGEPQSAKMCEGQEQEQRWIKRLETEGLEAEGLKHLGSGGQGQGQGQCHRRALPWTWSYQQLMPLLRSDYGSVEELLLPASGVSQPQLAHPQSTGQAEGIAPQAGFGAVLENVILHPHTAAPMLRDRRWSDHPHAALPRASQVLTGAPQTLVLCLPDHQGFFPAMARLTPCQFLYYYLCGYSNWAPSQELGEFMPCFAAEISHAEAIARVRCLGDRLAALTTSPKFLLVNPSSPSWLHSLQQPMSPITNEAETNEAATHPSAQSPTNDRVPVLTPEYWSLSLTGVAERLALAQQLFQHFDQHIETFRAELPDAITSAGPRL